MTERLKGWRYRGEKSGWIGEEWPVAVVPFAPEVSGYGRRADGVKGKDVGSKIQGG